MTLVKKHNYMINFKTCHTHGSTRFERVAREAHSIGECLLGRLFCWVIASSRVTGR